LHQIYKDNWHLYSSILKQRCNRTLAIERGGRAHQKRVSAGSITWRAHCRFGKQGSDYRSGSGIEWMNSGAKRVGRADHLVDLEDLRVPQRLARLVRLLDHCPGRKPPFCLLRAPRTHTKAP
jgi:hypothetical protein